MPRISSCSIDSNCPQKNRADPIGLHDSYLVILVNYFTSSKTTLTDYQCVSTGCCTHVAKTEITIDNQYVTNITAKVYISPQTTKRKHRKNHKLATFFWFWLGIECRNHKYSHCQNLSILATFSREACLGRIKYLPLLALSYSGIPVKELYYLFLWQIISKLNYARRGMWLRCQMTVCASNDAKYLIKSSNFHHKQ